MAEIREAVTRICHRCRKTLNLGDRIGRRELCSFCGADLHVCLNCAFYESGVYNDCREPQAERVLNKDRANFCDYFLFRNGSDKTPPSSPDEISATDRLEALFSKGRT
jgi:hypothetical protein